MSKNTQKALADETSQLVHQITHEGIDGIIGGWPCQDISIAGKGSGLSGERSGLWRYFYRAIRLVRPKVAVLENVAALLHRGMGNILGDLASIGYDSQWHCIQADAVGLPHVRKRVFTITYPSSNRIQRLFPKEIQRQPALPWSEDIRSVEELRNRPDIPEPLICRSHDGVAKRLHAIGNGNPPDIVRQITENLELF